MWISLHSTTREGFDGKVILSTLFCLLINVVFLLQVSIKDVLLRNNK
jgi:hypothetical protein